MKTFTRLIQILFFILFAMPGLALIVMAFTGQPEQRTQKLVMGLVMIGIAMIPVLIFQWQARNLARATAAIQAKMDVIGNRLFDAPVKARNDFDGTVLIGAFENLIRAFDGNGWPAAEGMYRGAKVLAASHASVMGRQMFEMYHVYSYVVVDLPGFSNQFALTEKSSVGNLLGGGGNVKTGDPAFDAAWSVDASESDAKAGLTDMVRERLVDLRSKVTLVSQDFAQGRMNVRISPRGLTLRWPGELNLELAEFIRDMMFEMRGGLISRH